MFIIKPLSETQVISWGSYCSAIEEFLDRSATAGFDAKYMTLEKNSLSHFLATLREVEYPGTNPFDPVYAHLDHAHMSMLLIATKELGSTVISKSRLHATTVQTARNDFSLSILSGTLAQWRIAIINTCDPSVSQEIREFGTAVLEYFNKIDLRQVVSGLVQTPMGDKTIRVRAN